jgi:hypothetical protein
MFSFLKRRGLLGDVRVLEVSEERKKPKAFFGRIEG